MQIPANAGDELDKPGKLDEVDKAAGAAVWTAEAALQEP